MAERGKKEPYRALNPAERDMLFSFYEKHNGNMLAMSRDHECVFKAYNQIRYYARTYGFEAQLIEIRQKRAREIIASLADSKIMAIQRAIEMIEPRQRPLRMPISGDPMLDKDGQPIFETIYPTHKEIKAAWEILKTELGEPTSIMKSEVENPHAMEVSKALDIIANLAHGAVQTDGGAVPGKRESAGDPAPVSAPVQHDLSAESPEE